MGGLKKSTQCALWCFCSLYTQIDKNALSEYKEFCKHFTGIEKRIVIPKYFHTNEDLIVEDKTNENFLDLNSYEYDNNMTMII